MEPRWRCTSGGAESTGISRRLPTSCGLCANCPRATTTCFLEYGRHESRRQPVRSPAVAQHLWSRRAMASCEARHAAQVLHFSTIPDTRLSFGRGARTDALSQPRRPPTPFQPGPRHELRHFSLKSMCRCTIASQGSKSWSDVDVYDESGSDSCLRDLLPGLRRWRGAL